MAYVFPVKIFPNALNNFLQCPFKFKCHNDKDVKAEFVETPQSFVGSVIHSVLNDFFNIKNIPIDKRKEQDLSLMVKHSWARMTKNNWSKEYWSAKERLELFGSQEQEKAFGLEAIAMLNNYISTADLSVVPLSLEDWLDCEVAGFKLGGRIDRIDQESADSIAIWDYKTGKLPFHNSVEKIIKEDIQLPVYAIIAAQLYPFSQKIRVGLIYLKYSKVYEITWTREEIKELEKQVVSIIEKAKNDQTLLPQLNKLCFWCEYKGVCPEKDKIEKKPEKVDEVPW